MVDAMRAVEMIDHQVDLLIRLSDPDVRELWIRQLTEDKKENNERAGVQDNVAKLAASTGIASMNSLDVAVQEAKAFHVSAELTQLTIFSASQLDDEDQIDSSLAPTRSGIARFEGGLPYQDVRGNKLIISWIVWGPVLVARHTRHDIGQPELMTAIWMWNDHYEEPDDIGQQILNAGRHSNQGELANRIMGRWGFIGNGIMIDGTRLGPAWFNAATHTAWPVESFDFTPQEFTNVSRFIHAFFLLLGQTITSRRSVIPSRPTRRRAQRAKIPQQVTVVALRNVESQRSDTESLIDWSHRWVVRGFWRWQVCGPHHQLAQELEPGKWRARIWIAPYIKGPEGKPLIITNKVYSVHR